MSGYARPMSTDLPEPAELRRGNLGGEIPDELPDELIENLFEAPGVRVERIVSRGHASPPGFWYDQDETELVLLVSGAAALELAGGERVEMAPGDWVLLPAGLRHRVAETAPDGETLWLAVFVG